MGLRSWQLIDSAGKLRVLRDQASRQVPSHVSGDDHTRDQEWPDASQKSHWRPLVGGHLCMLGQEFHLARLWGWNRRSQTVSADHPLETTSVLASAPHAHTAPQRGPSLPCPPCQVAWPQGEGFKIMKWSQGNPTPVPPSPSCLGICVCGGDTTSRCLLLFFCFSSCYNWQLCFLKWNELKIQMLTDDQYPSSEKRDREQSC